MLLSRLRAFSLLYVLFPLCASEKKQKMKIVVHPGFKNIVFEHRTEAAKRKGKLLVEAGHVFKVVEKKLGEGISYVSASVARQANSNLHN